MNEQKNGYVPCGTCGDWDRIQCALATCPECSGLGYVTGTPQESAAEAVAAADLRASGFDFGAEVQLAAAMHLALRRAMEGK